MSRTSLGAVSLYVYVSWHIREHRWVNASDVAQTDLAVKPRALSYESFPPSSHCGSVEQKRGINPVIR